MLEAGSTFPIDTVGFLIAEVFGYLSESALEIEHMSEDCTAG